VKVTVSETVGIMGHKGLAETGVRLPSIGLGIWQYKGGIEPLQTGIALGACFIDTAESYDTEEIVGRAIKQNRKATFLATKVPPRHFRCADVIAAAEGSLKRLKTNYVDSISCTGHRGSVEIFLRHIARQGLQYLCKNQ